jgi:nucleotide-binding universal stress UspA family protein
MGARLVVVCAFDRRDDLRPQTTLGSLDPVTRRGRHSTGNEEHVPGELAWAETEAGRAEEIALQAAQSARDAGVEHVEARAVPGPPAEALLTEGESLGADLVVVGSKGMRSWSRFLLGSVPNAVSHHAQCDVLIVRTTDR